MKQDIVKKKKKKVTLDSFFPKLFWDFMDKNDE